MSGMLTGHRHASELSKRTKWVALSSASVTLKPWLQDVEPVCFLPRHRSVFQRWLWESNIHNIMAKGLLCSMNLIGVQIWNISPYMKVLIICIWLIYFGRERRQTSDTSLKYLNLGLFAHEVPFWQSGFEEDWLPLKIDSAQHRILQRNEHKKVLLCVLDITPLVFFHSDPHFFVLMSNSALETHSGCPSLH